MKRLFNFDLVLNVFISVLCASKKESEIITLRSNGPIEQTQKIRITGAKLLSSMIKIVFIVDSTLCVCTGLESLSLVSFLSHTCG